MSSDVFPNYATDSKIMMYFKNDAFGFCAFQLDRSFNFHVFSRQSEEL